MTHKGPTKDPQMTLKEPTKSAEYDNALIPKVPKCIDFKVINTTLTSQMQIQDIRAMQIIQPCI